MEYCDPADISFTAEGGSEPYSWTILSGNVPGLSLDPTTGIWCGVPEQVGSFEVVVRVQDDAQLFDTSLFTVDVMAGSELAVSVFSLDDTPINTDANGLPRILGAGLPVLLYLYAAPSTTLDTALGEAAEDFAGDALIVRLNTTENPDVYQQYGSLGLPALVTLDDGEVESQAAHITAEDVDDHIMFLMGQGPLPQETAAERAAQVATGAAPVHTADADFQRDVLESDIPVLVDFWAPWCGPCKTLGPAIEAAVTNAKGRVKLVKIDVDANQAYAGQLQVQSIPTVYAFFNGQPVDGFQGALPPSEIDAFVE